MATAVRDARAGVAESGIEDLTIEMRPIVQRPHHQDPGFNGPNFQAALNCWARRVDLWHSDNGFGLTTAKGITLTEVRVGGARFEILPATTPVSPGAAYHGINTEGFTSGNVWSNGNIEGTFDSHKALPFDSVRTAIRVDNTGTTGAPAMPGRGGAPGSATGTSTCATAARTRSGWRSTRRCRQWWPCSARAVRQTTPRICRGR